MGKNKKKNVDLTEIDEKLLNELSSDSEFKMQLEVAKRAVKEVASTNHIDGDIDTEDYIKEENSNESFGNGYFDKGPNKQQIIDFFEKENIAFSKTQIDKLFDTKEEIDRLRIENKRLEKEKSESDFLFRTLEEGHTKSLEEVAELKEKVELNNTEISNLEGEVKNRERQLLELTNSLTEKNKEMIDKVIKDYNSKMKTLEDSLRISNSNNNSIQSKISQKDSEITKLTMELDDLKSYSNVTDYKRDLLRLRQIEAITEELLKTVSKYPKVYDEYKDTIKRVASEIRNIKV